MKPTKLPLRLIKRKLIPLQDAKNEKKNYMHESRLSLIKKHGLPMLARLVGPESSL